MATRQEQASRLPREMPWKAWTSPVVRFQRFPVPPNATASLAFPLRAANLHPGLREWRNRLQERIGPDLWRLVQGWRESILHPPEAFPAKVRAMRKDHLRI